MTLSHQYLLNKLKRPLFAFALSLTFCSQYSVANDELVIVVGLAKQPYVIQDDDSGFELDLIRNILKKMGKSTKFIYTTFGHSSKMFKIKEVDAIMTTNKAVFKDQSKLSDVYITYQNVAISLKDNNLTINTIKDLANYSIASFQKADKLLGSDFADAAKQSPLYFEVANQSQQPTLLLKKRVEALVMDKNIFKYFTKDLSNKERNALFTFHQIFPGTDYKVAFKNKEYLRIFNNNLAKYKQTKEYLLLRKNYNL
jgi:polar amino acid transport system substrate-binding protein